MPIEGFEIRADGPQSGLLWITFQNIQVHGTPGTRAYEHGMKQKADIVMKTIRTELDLKTRHYNKRGKFLDTIEKILKSYEKERGVYVQFAPDRKAPIRRKIEALAAKYGIGTKGHEADPNPPGPGLQN